MSGRAEDARQLIAFCHLLNGNGNKRYQLMQSILQTRFHLPEFDFVRDEFGRCYVVEAYQACITLTNHLLERYLKIFLITKESGFTKVSKLEGWEALFENANAKYLNKDLSDTLKAFKSLGLLSKQDWKRFDTYREQIRNGFGHADPQKIFGDLKGRFAMGRLDGGQDIEVKELQFSKIPMLQGIAIQFFAERNALRYFVEVENLIRRTINHLQADEDKVSYQMVELIYPQKSET